MSIIPGNAQHIGSRAEQQDAFGFSDIADKAFTRHGGVLAVVADGMGGLANGRDASTLAVRTMLAAYATKAPAEPIPAALYRAIVEANRAVNDFAHSQGKAGGVGTTLIATVLHGEELHWIAAGDSRIYMVRDGRCTQINVDHVYARELRLRAARGEIPAEQVHTHPEREALTSFLGDREIAEIDRSAVPVLLRPGDRLILCTDGLYRAVPEGELAALAVRGSSSAAADAMVARALAARIPNQDNATVALLTVPDPPGKRKTAPMVAVGAAGVAVVVAGVALSALWPAPVPPPVNGDVVVAAPPPAAVAKPPAPEGEVTENTIQKLLDKKPEQPKEEPKPPANADKPKAESAPSPKPTQAKSKAPEDGNSAKKPKDAKAVKKAEELKPAKKAEAGQGGEEVPAAPAQPPQKPTEEAGAGAGGTNGGGKQ